MWRTLLIAMLAAGLARPAELQVAAAADLAQIENALGAAFTKQSAGATTIRWITGSSGLLEKQAENGAPFDVFLSASESYVNDLVAHDAALKDTVVLYASGHAGLWMPPGSRAAAGGGIHELKDLLKPEVQHVSIANPAHAPYGAAAKEALVSAGLWEKLEGKLVYGENVRQAMQFGESGNVDAVLTAWALVKSKPGAVELDPESAGARYKALRQAGVVLKSSHESKAAREFLKFLTSPAARAIFNDAGFSTSQ